MGLKAPFPGHTLKATFDDIRRDLEGIIVRDVAGKARAGVFPDHTGELFVRQSSMKLGVKPFRAAQVRSGVVLLANDGVELVTLAAAPSANRRIDLVYVTARSTSAPWGDTADTPAFGVIQGIASATPVAPSLPPALADALPLFTVEIAAGATTTQAAGVIITQVFPYTAAAGGTVVVRNLVELAAWEPADGARAFAISDKAWYLRRAGSWAVSPDSETPWVPIHGLFGIAGSWPNLAGFATGVKRVGDWVHIRGALSNTGNFTSFATLGNAPIGWRPDSGGGEYFQVLQGGSASPKQIRLLADGTLQVHSLGQTGAAWIFANISYHTSDPFPIV